MLSQRTLAFIDQLGKCYFCELPMVLPTGPKQTKRTATWDHLTPRCRGGKNGKFNKKLVCFKCNKDKAHLTEQEYRAVLEVRGGKKC